MTETKSRSKQFDWRGLGYLYLFFWYFSGVTQTLLLVTKTTPSGGFGNIIYLSAIWLIPVLLFPKYTKLLSGIIGLVLWAASLVSLGYFSIYGQEFSQSVIFVIFETNTAEIGEYITQYFNIWTALLLIAYSLIGLFLWTRIRPVYLPSHRILICTALFLSIIAYPILKSISSTWGNTIDRIEAKVEPAVPWQLLVGYHEYQKQLTEMKKLLDSNAALPPLQNLQEAGDDKQRTVVLVIGESTSTKHMSLYGYPRKTTPELDALRDAKQITVFKDVVAPRPYTIETLQQVLTFADELHPDLYLTQPSLMNMMKQAGYKTFWITNQQTISKRNTMLVNFSQQTDEQYYLNNQRKQNAKQYDGVVLDPFKKVLNDSAPKKLIIVHLLGTHMSYQYRYPEAFAKFKDRDVVPSTLNQNSADEYNTYDNAVLYNDYVVSSLIKDMAASDPNGFLIYFSDHGEEVYDMPPHNIIGRDEAAPTRNMYTIPFILWTSPKWQANHPRHYQADVERPYSTQYFIHTWSDMLGLSYDGFEPEKSVVSDKFKPTTRWIGAPGSHKGLYDFAKLPVESTTE